MAGSPIDLPVEISTVCGLAMNLRAGAPSSGVDMKWTISIGAVALAALGQSYAYAQDFGSGEDDGAATKLGRLVVTAPLRRESTLARSTSSVIVIGRQQIEQSAAADLPSLLKSYPGVSVTSNGGIGAVSGVSIRGTAANQTLVLVNGVRAGTATLGTVRLSSIPLDSIDRIEIAKGAHSAQYGADAIGGVINIITRQGGPCDDGRDACGSVTVGVTHPWGGYLSGDVHGQSGNGMNYAFGGQLLGTQGYAFTT
jgi:vitamin B12 transporter